MSIEAKEQVLDWIIPRIDGLPFCFTWLAEIIVYEYVLLILYLAIGAASYHLNISKHVIPSYEPLGYAQGFLFGVLMFVGMCGITKGYAVG